MCFICDGGSFEELAGKVHEDIEMYGWHVMGVESAGHAPTGWAYTIGLCESFGHPELCITGMCCFRHAHETLNELAHLVADGVQFDVGDEVPCTCHEHPAARFGKVHPRHWESDRFSGWLAHYEDDPSGPLPLMLQVIVTYRARRLQDDPLNKRWPFDRLDRAPHISAKSRRLLR